MNDKKLTVDPLGKIAEMFQKFLEDLFKEFQESREFAEAFEKFIKRKYRLKNDQKP